MAATMSVARETGPSKALWQYHSQSDHHSQVSCWSVLFDLLRESALMRSHVLQDKIHFGVNHSMVDFVNRKKKKLDLVVCRKDGTSTGRTFTELGQQLGVVLSPPMESDLSALPPMREAPVGSVLVALEAKVCMTAHVKSLPRLFDELNSSHQIVHGASNAALSIGMVTVNVSDEFISSKRNVQHDPTMRTVISTHRQPAAAQRVVDMVENLPRRTSTSSMGYDGLGIIGVNLRNDTTTTVTVHRSPPIPKPGDIFHYETMLRRMANEYDSAFARI
jgi:hypothetical protein